MVSATANQLMELQEKTETTVAVEGKYALVQIDDSNESWSKPEWITFTRDTVIRLIAMGLGGYLIFAPPPEGRDYLSLGVTIFSGAAALQAGAMGGRKKK